jgi:hypothetical protein
MLVLDMIEILPPLGKYKFDTWRILPVKCYTDNSMRLRSCIRNMNTGLWAQALLSVKVALITSGNRPFAALGLPCTISCAFYEQPSLHLSHGISS